MRSKALEFLMGGGVVSDPILDMLGDLPDFPGKTPPRNRPDSPKRPVAEDRYNGARSKVFRVNGEDREFYTVGEVARALQRKPITVRMWEHKGWIPKANYRTPPPQGEQLPGKEAKGRRLYSREQLDFLLDALDRFRLDSKEADWNGFRKYVTANWPR
jgi:hypothetical protein